MKVVCVNEFNMGFLDEILCLTKGKEYDCVLVEGNYYLILLDNGYTRWFEKGLFLTLEEYRNRRLEEIGI